jgi:hypothetical protein
LSQHEHSHANHHHFYPESQEGYGGSGGGHDDIYQGILTIALLKFALTLELILPNIFLCETNIFPCFCYFVVNALFSYVENTQAQGQKLES